MVVKKFEIKQFIQEQYKKGEIVQNLKNRDILSKGYFKSRSSANSY